MGTGKEQSIQITASSGLSEEEIKQLIKDAEMHAGEDRKKRELIDARNMADSLIYTTEKSIKEAGGSVDDSTKAGIDQAIENLKKVMEGEDTAQIKRLTEELTQASHKLAEAMYARASQQQAQAGGTGASEDAGGGTDDEDVVDADFEEVKK
jgi:molecular chaperone DnaK